MPPHVRSRRQSDQIPGWTAAIDGEDTDWHGLLDGYVAQVDWPGASFWPELVAANPDALVIASIRDTDAWYESASNTIFQVFDKLPPEYGPWFESVARLMAQRFSAELDNPTAMMDAYERHNAAVRKAVPDEPFPVTNQMTAWRENFGMPPL